MDKKQTFIVGIKEQPFTELLPGTVVKDINTLLKTISKTKLPLTPKKTSIANDLLPSLNESMVNPHKVNIPVKISVSLFPNMKGLYLLLRASNLTKVELVKLPVLSLHKSHYAQWEKLNTTEQFVWLLESWILRGHPEIIGEGRDISRNISDWIYFGMACFKKAWVNTDGRSNVKYSPGYVNIALMQLFGFIDVSENKTDSKERNIHKITLTNFGRSYFGSINEIFDELDWLFEPEVLISPIKDNLIDVKKSITLQKSSALKGSVVFEISLGRCKRKIELPVNNSLGLLFHEIIEVFDFDYDHLYEFRIKNQAGITQEYGHSHLDSCDEYADDVKLSDLELTIGQEFKLIYDFGDNWQFKIKLIAINMDSTIKKAILLEKRGEAPEQYPNWDE